MLPFASNLRRRAEELGISNAEVARRVGLSERRYANYVSGKREPDLATLLQIAKTLATTPNRLLGIDDERPSRYSLLLDRLVIAATSLPVEDLDAIVAQTEALRKLRGPNTESGL